MRYSINYDVIYRYNGDVLLHLYLFIEYATHVLIAKYCTKFLGASWVIQGS
jgi:hypothetical protein